MNVIVVNHQQEMDGNYYYLKKFYKNYKKNLKIFLFKNNFK